MKKPEEQYSIILTVELSGLLKLEATVLSKRVLSNTHNILNILVFFRCYPKLHLNFRVVGLPLARTSHDIINTLCKKLAAPKDFMIEALCF